MARSKKRAVSPYERQRWLEDYEKDKGITEISNTAHRDIRIVKRHIEIAREERVVARTRHDFLLGRLQQHQEDLFEEVRRLKQMVPRYPPHTLIPEDTMKQKIHGVFREHIRGLVLKKLLGNYDEAVMRFRKTRETVKDELAGKEEELLDNLPEGVNTYPWTQALLEVVEMGLPLDKSSGRQYEQERQTDGFYNIKWGAGDLTRSPVLEANVSIVVDLHRNLVSHASSFQSVFQEHGQRLKEIGGLVVEELDTLIMKRVVLGHCRYCPI